MERGLCHVCKLDKEIGYCALCEHWFCEGCRAAWFHRGLEWVKQLVGGKVEGCCGPEASSLRGDLR